jgi:cytoskeletal protein CcmA (bactofilin family)
MFNSLMGPGSIYCGDIDTQGLVRVDGVLEGSIKTNGSVVLSKNARCNGFIQAQSAVIGGIVRGNVYTTGKLELLQGAVVVGDIFTSQLSTEQDVIIHGACRVVGKDFAAKEKALREFISQHGGFPLKPKSDFLREALKAESLASSES